MRLTPAQRNGLRLLAHPGAEARTGRGIRWRVLASDEEIGSIHSETLLILRCEGLVIWLRVDGSLSGVQRITDLGRQRLDQQAQPAAEEKPNHV
jgi:hypothetical protein